MNKKVSSSLYKAITMAYQYVTTHHQRGKQVITAFIEINIRELHMNLWSLEVEDVFFLASMHMDVMSWKHALRDTK